MENKEYFVEGGLENLIKRLEKGTILKGRIVDCASENRYLLRIWGYNILTESKKRFNKFDEVHLIVEETTPHLILNFANENSFNNEVIPSDNAITNILA
ncbi:MAG: hypothetical protein P9X24_18175 [Candidatus Hatepunaea meridiana]|nr:hypothetical protein [Candidatus Hatepunaea meridiana]